MRRIIYYIFVNVGILLTIAIVTQLLGLDNYITAQGLDYYTLLLFCLVWGMAGSFISLALSRWMAIRIMRVKIINLEQADSIEKDLYNLVRSLISRSDLPMPEVGIYPSQEINAFATGASRKKALVAVSSGLLQQADQKSLEAILAHEVSHIRNGDMVTMALIQGIVNAFVLFISRIIGYAISRGDRDSQAVFLVTTILAQIVFSILGSILVLHFSRTREYRADKGSGQLTSNQQMIHALQFLQKKYHPARKPTNQRQMNALMINDQPSRFAKIFSTHPPLEERIKALQEG